MTDWRIVAFMAEIRRMRDASREATRAARRKACYRNFCEYSVRASRRYLDQVSSGATRRASRNPSWNIRQLSWSQRTRSIHMLFSVPGASRGFFGRQSLFFVPILSASYHCPNGMKTERIAGTKSLDSVPTSC